MQVQIFFGKKIPRETENTTSSLASWTCKIFTIFNTMSQWINRVHCPQFCSVFHEQHCYDWSKVGKLIGNKFGKHGKRKWGFSIQWCRLKTRNTDTHQQLRINCSKGQCFSLSKPWENSRNVLQNVKNLNFAPAAANMRKVVFLIKNTSWRKFRETFTLRKKENHWEGFLFLFHNLCPNSVWFKMRIWSEFQINRSNES